MHLPYLSTPWTSANLGFSPGLKCFLLVFHIFIMMVLQKNLLRPPIVEVNIVRSAIRILPSRKLLKNATQIL